MTEGVTLRADSIHYTLQFDINDGKMSDFESLAQKACDTVLDTEPGTITYGWQVDGSGTKVQLHERFDSEASMLAHLGGPVATGIFPELMAISDVTRFDVHGDPSPEAAEVLGNFGGTVFGGWKGFDR
jgi:quinol monooxygenase YgiN